ncbi:MAG: hypothetical protein FJ399_03225 [Verrucomicrobia bacterium]|nr:hypothetical protein [Verrucomicrobiota bacterium]
MAARRWIGLRFLRPCLIAAMPRLRPLLVLLWVAATARAAEPLEFQVRGGLPHVAAKIALGQEVRVAFLGGSITAAAGWRVFTLDHLRRTYPQAKFTEIFAAVSGTGSNYGAMRLQRFAPRPNRCGRRIAVARLRRVRLRAFLRPETMTMPPRSLPLPLLRWIATLVFAAVALPAFAQETAAQRAARLQWWREARFGMFVHWGLYSGLAGTWDGKAVAQKGGMEWIQQRVKADTATYAQRALPLFQPSPGFARAWARLAKTAGCRYLVFTTKHHDGFALHDSKVSDFDAGSKLNRDLVREIVDACRAEGLRVGFYHSVIDWHHNHYAYARSKQLPHPLKGQPYPNGERDHAKYVAYLHAEVRELVSNYGPVDILWWDYSAQDFQGDEAWRATELMSLVRTKQPASIQNNRLYRTPEAGWKSMGTEGYAPQLDPRFGDFITPEQHIPATGMPGVDWETCMTLNTTWGYSDHDHAWKSDETLIRNLVDIASKGGNYLLNVGPKGDGSLTPETMKAFTAIGAWMKVNGESIYGTTASPVAAPDWGRYTRQGRTLYAHVFKWPADGALLVPFRNQVTSAKLLAAPGAALKVTTSPEGLRLQLPATAPDATASVVALRLEGDPLPIESARP